AATPRASSREVMTTRQPRAVSSVAVARPIRPVPPVISATGRNLLCPICCPASHQPDSVHLPDLPSAHHDTFQHPVKLHRRLSRIRGDSYSILPFARSAPLAVRLPERPSQSS